MSICIIPARAGSKRIPEKNTRTFCGIPMLERGILKAQASGLFDAVLVSTDDAKAQSIATGQHAGWMGRRPELTDDHATTLEVMTSAVQTLGVKDDYEIVCCLYPCTPLLNFETIRRAAEIIGTSDYVVPVTRFQPQRAIRIDELGHPLPVWPQFADTRTQDLEPRYRDAGQFYLGRALAWRTGRPIYGTRSRAMEIPASEAIDIDTEEDWQMAEAIMRGRRT